MQKQSKQIAQQTSLSLNGEGVSPRLTIIPNETTLSMGMSIANETLKRSFKIGNTSNFEVSYTLNLKRDGERNHNRINAFHVIPCQVTLQAGMICCCYSSSLVIIAYYSSISIFHLITIGEEQDILVLFTADHEHYGYTDTIIIESENKVRSNQIGNKQTNKQTILFNQ